MFVTHAQLGAHNGFNYVVRFIDDDGNIVARVVISNN